MTQLGTGQVAIVTGAARGIGLATARALRARGVRLAIADIDEGELERAAQTLGADVYTERLDVSDRAQFQRFVDNVSAAVGGVDILINNAGIMPIGPMLEETEATARSVFEVNVLGVLNGMAAVLPGMLARRGGHIVNVSSVAGRSPVPGGASYAASKAAVVSVTETARVEYASTGVEFTCVMPSFTATELITGTKGTKGVKTITPEAVAQAITAGIEKSRYDVFVPGSIGVILKLQSLLGRRLRDAGNRALGGDRAFLDIDKGARAAYSSRIAEQSEQAAEDRAAA